MKWTLHQLEDWKAVALEVGSCLKAGDWLRLEGDLGVGKTTFVRSLLEHWGWKDEVVSPTYPLLVEYEVGDRKIIHLDGYRLSGTSPDPWDYREWENYFLLVEWSEKTQLPLEKFSYKLAISLEENGQRNVKLT